MRWFAAVAACTVALAGCSATTPGETTPPPAGDESSNGEPSGGEASGASGTVEVDGETYEITDVRECEVDGETWGQGWRDFTGFSSDGTTLVNIVIIPPGQSDIITNYFAIKIGLKSDFANPDIEWSTDYGGEMRVDSLTDTGASGSASVTALTVDDGAIESEATWSFTCG